MKPLRKIYIIFLGFLLFLGACENPLDDKKTTQGFTLDDEQELGDEIHNAMVASSLFKVLSNEEGTTYFAAHQYLAGLRGKIWGTGYLEHQRDFKWTIHILEDDTNQRCFTTVGGKIYVTTGLLRDMVNNEAELYGVLAHEIYYADRHYHMDKLLEGYTFTEILDVKHGGSNAKALEMVGTFYNTPRNADLVHQADLLAADIVCAIGGLSIKAFGNAIENAELTGSDWYINHPTPNIFSSVQERKEELNIKAVTCGNNDENEVNLNKYLAFLDILPPR
ncbi:MAG: M48 family metalloprotease [Saprospiraceae bacterium]